METTETTSVRALRPATRSVSPAVPRPQWGSRLAGGALAAVLLANLVVVVRLWVHGGGLSYVGSLGEALTSGARLTGLLAAYLALVQVVLLARLPWLERLVGFDRLTLWHRSTGPAVLALVVAHVVLSIWGYASLDRVGIGSEVSLLLTGGVYPGMITATIGTALFVLVSLSSVAVARRALPYEAWYAVHLTAYAAIALAWFHQIPTGNELMLDAVAAWYWRALYLTALALVLWFRIGVPLANVLRFRLRVVAVEELGSDAVSLVIAGRGLDRLGARAGQFLLWRFLTRGQWWSSHPYSLSEAPRGDRLRITVKALGDHSAALRHVRPGTRIVAEGPFGVFTERARRLDKVVLIGGGIGIAPIRALVEVLRGDVVVLYRVLREADVVLHDELERLAAERGFALHVLIGDHATCDDPLSPARLEELVPDLSQREVFVCGPPGMTEAAVRSARQARVPRRRIHAERFAY
jgi:predicted ferric reductase